MLLNCACILVRVLEKKTGFHYFIFNRKPLHWDGHGLGLGLGLDQLALALSVLALLTTRAKLHCCCAIVTAALP